MPTSPFHTMPVATPGFFERLFRRPQRTAAATELRNLLALRDLSTVSLDEFSAILEARRVRGAHVAEMLRTIWADALRFFAGDGTVSGEAAAYLAELQRIARLTDHDVGAARRAFGTELVRKCLGQAAAARLISGGALARVANIAQTFGVPEEDCEAIHKAVAHPVYQAELDRSMADRELSPDEDRRLSLLAVDLDINPVFDAATSKQLHRFRLLWQIRNLHIPTIDPPIHLQRGEECYFAIPANWHELRKEVTRVGYSGPVATIHIAKGISYRMASYKPRVISHDVLTHIDSGTLYATNKRVIFDGGKKNTAIRYSSILGFTPYADGVGIEKATGKSPVLALSGDCEIATTILCQALARS